MKCAHCSTENEPDARFCKSCGAPLEAPVQPVQTGEMAADKETAQSYAKPIQIKAHSWFWVLLFPIAVVGILLISLIFTLIMGG